MHTIYYFDFLRTVSIQLKEELDGVSQSSLDLHAIEELSAYQKVHESSQGVYVIHYHGLPVYVGKANNVSERLAQHFEKLNGRKGIEVEQVSYKAILLDKSMSTAANEDILIGMFREDNQDMWNGAGFGPKDPGKERDTTKPGKFDTRFPIKDEFPVTLVEKRDEAITLRALFRQMKDQLPYVFRYNVPAEQLEKVVLVPNGELTARALLKLGVDALGPGWKGVIISYGMVLYKTTKEYRYGEEILPEGGN